MVHEWDEERVNWLRLARTDGITPHIFAELLRIYGSATNIIKVLPQLSHNARKKYELKSIADIDKEIKATDKFGAKIILSCDAEYPKLLKNIHSYPPVIVVLGSYTILNNMSVAIVGNRSASFHGKNFATKLAKDLFDAGVTIVSGLARGIDTAAHKAAVNNTIAVVAGGINSIYPQENTDLFYQIAKNGSVISERGFNEPPKAQFFPQRNRIISALAQVVVVVEANVESGSLVTARYALEQGKELCAVPGYPSDPRSKGPNKLIKQGAHLVESADDVLALLSNIPLWDVSTSNDSEINIEDSNELENIEYESIDDKILSLLSNKPLAIDLIAEQLGCTIDVVLRALVTLELSGQIYRHVGNQVSLVMN